MTTINIEWEKFDYSPGTATTEEMIGKLSTPIDYGIYQIYGWHPSYGPNALLYIGKSKFQTFSQRLRQRFEFLESCASPNSLRIGRIVKDSDPNNILEWDETKWKEVIDLCEALLLHSHTPAFNRQDIGGLVDYKNDENNIHILNWGAFGNLLPEVSTYRFSYKYWNYENQLRSKESD